MILKRDNVEIVVDNALEIEARKAEGFEEVGTVKAAAPALESLTVKELHELAKAHGVQGATSLRKAELIEVLKKVEK